MEGSKRCWRHVFTEAEALLGSWIALHSLKCLQSRSCRDFELDNAKVGCAWYTWIWRTSRAFLIAFCVEVPCSLDEWRVITREAILAQPWAMQWHHRQNWLRVAACLYNWKHISHSNWVQLISRVSSSTSSKSSSSSIMSTWFHTRCHDGASIRTWSGKLQTTRIWTTFGMTHTSLTLFMKQTSFGTPTLGSCSLCRSKVLFKTTSLVVLNLQSITLCGSGLLGQENVLASLSHWSIWRRDHQNSSIHLACSSAVNTATVKELYRLGLLVGWLMRKYKTVHTRRQTDRQAGRQTDRQTCRQTDRQAGRQLASQPGIQTVTNLSPVIMFFT